MTPIAPEGRRPVEAATARSSNELPSSEPFYRLAEGLDESDAPRPFSPWVVVGAALAAIFGLGAISGALLIGVKAAFGS